MTTKATALAFLLLVTTCEAAVLPASTRSIGTGEDRPLSFEERVAAQRAIEEVYWRHRIWPKENPTAKPPLSEVLPDNAIRAKVEDYLKKSNALETWWQRPITAEQLQAEIDRMARGTRDPEMLRELHAVLGNDAYLVAETLARQTLVEQLIRNWYATDERFHGTVKREAAQTLAGMRSVAEMKALGGEYLERTFVRRESDEGVVRETPADGVVELGAEEWKQWSEDLARRFGTTADALPVQRVSALQDDSDRFFVTAVLSLEADETVVATVVWPKRSFDAWWSEERVGASAEVVAEVGDYTIVAPMGAACVDDTWKSRFYVPSGRGYHTAVWTGTEMIVWGGFNGSFLNTGGRYDPSTDSWIATSTGANVPSARREHTAVWTGTEMIVWGGDINPTYLNTGARYNPSADSWTATSTGANVPSARTAHTAVWTGTEMIVWGGFGGSFLNTGGRYKPSADSWVATSTGANVPTGRAYHTAVWTGTQVMVWGGHVGSSFLNTGGRYDPSTDSWTATSTGANVPSGRNLHTAVWTGTEMMVWGGWIGSSSGVLNTGGRYNPSTDSWTATSMGENVPSGRFFHTAVWTGAEMIVWGGVDDGDFLNTGGRYNPSTDSWAATSTGANTPSARRYHTAVWTGQEMIVWGGQGAIDANTGGRYDPSTDSWIATSTGMNVPSARGFHTAVWTGTEMIVWGGFGGSYLSTGGRYNSSTDSWIATSTGANVPSGRNFHTAVWTGTEMIVWGGRNDNHLNTGGRYNPSTDSWIPTSTGANSSSARNAHTAIWTGTEMIVWGGFNGSFLNTGGRYDPSTDSWTATSTGANVPSGRNLHTAVWTGTEMMVWGGFGGSSGVLNTGGKYSPSTDSWTETTAGNAPSGRRYHTAVWTGAEMIVWAGDNGSFLNTGGRYNPSTDSWAATSTGANTPSARRYHTAVWTGAEMVVWGGDDSIYLNTGGRYNPSIDSWTATSTGADVPSARYGHAAVWTGAEMIVWGGYLPDSNLGLYCASGCLPTPDSDGDGVGDVCDSAPANPNVCRDLDADSCDDCTSGAVDPSSDGLDTDGDGECDAGDNCDGVANAAQTDTNADGEGDACDTDDDGDGVVDAQDSASLDRFVCQDADADTCNDCVSGTVNPANDGLDTDGDGACDAGDPDDDGDGIGDAQDSQQLNPFVCQDSDADTCDDCTIGTVNPTDDGLDTDSDGACDGGDNCDAVVNPAQTDTNSDGEGDACDADDDGDGVDDTQDSQPLNRFVCQDIDADMCDDCTNGTANTAADGLDTDSDGACNAGDPDDDGDGVSDVQDNAPLDRLVCQDVDVDTCDDCVSGTVNQADDGVDTDADGVCNAGDPDDDNDGVADAQDSHPLNRFACQDVDADTCDDCVSGTASPADDGLDTDADGACDVGDNCDPVVNPAQTDTDGDDLGDACDLDDDNDGVADGEDFAPLNRFVCHDVDADACDDCSSGSVNPANDGPDPDADGLCDLGDNCPAAYNPDQADTDHDTVGNACDNCIVLPNDQSDLDSDGRGDMCDNCLSSFNPFQNDFDEDEVGDVCDNCFFDANPNQTDVDEDQEGDHCDLDDGVIYLSFKIKNRLLWQDEAGFDTWNAYRGDLGVLLSGGSYTQEPGSNPLAARQCGMTATSWQGVGTPGPGQAAFFLVTGVAMGVEGDLGVESSGQPRPNDHPCP